MLITDILSLFRQGKELKNAAAWKNATILANIFVTGGAVAKGFGYADIPMDQHSADALAGGIVVAIGLFNAIVHIVSSAKVGLPALPTDSRTDSASGQ